MVMSRPDKAQIQKHQASLRTRAIKRILAGESPEVIATVFKVHRSSIYNWLKRYREGDYEALTSRPITGRPRKLTEEQEKKLLKMLITRDPVKLKLDGALWTANMVQQLVESWNVTLSMVQIGRLLRSFGVSCERPLTRISNRNSQRMSRWLLDDYPFIKEKAKGENGDIFFVETRQIRNSLKMRKDIREVMQSKTKSGRTKLHLFAAVSSRGSMRFMISRGKPTPARFVAFLERLLQGAQNPVYVIGEGKSYEWRQRVRKFLYSTQGKLKLYYLPLYLPDQPSQ